MKSVAVLPRFFVELAFRYSLSMSFTAKRFQEIMAILKTWWQDGFAQRKVQGQHALCDAGRGCLGLVSVMFIATECQARGTLHVHSFLFTRGASLWTCGDAGNLYPWRETFLSTLVTREICTRGARRFSQRTREELEYEMPGQSVHPWCADQSTRWAEECTTGR